MPFPYSGKLVKYLVRESFKESLRLFYNNKIDMAVNCLVTEANLKLVLV